MTLIFRPAPPETPSTGPRKHAHAHVSETPPGPPPSSPPGAKLLVGSESDPPLSAVGLSFDGLVVLVEGLLRQLHLDPRAVRETLGKNLEKLSWPAVAVLPGATVADLVRNFQTEGSTVKDTKVSTLGYEGGRQEIVVNLTLVDGLGRELYVCAGGPEPDLAGSFPSIRLERRRADGTVQAFDDVKDPSVARDLLALIPDIHIRRRLGLTWPVGILRRLVERLTATVEEHRRKREATESPAESDGGISA